MTKELNEPVTQPLTTGETPSPDVGSPVSMGTRAGAFVVDAVLSALVAGLFTAPELPKNWSLVVLVAEYVVFSVCLGQTPGMRFFRIRLTRVDGGSWIGPIRALIRTLLVVLVVPALITDSNRRGLHDRATGTAVVRA